jgi:hypothetical protein
LQPFAGLPHLPGKGVRVAGQISKLRAKSIS